MSIDRDVGDITIKKGIESSEYVQLKRQISEGLERKGLVWLIDTTKELGYPGDKLISTIEEHEREVLPQSKLGIGVLPTAKEIALTNIERLTKELDNLNSGIDTKGKGEVEKADELLDVANRVYDCETRRQDWDSALADFESGQPAKMHNLFLREQERLTNRLSGNYFLLRKHRITEVREGFIRHFIRDGYDYVANSNAIRSELSPELQ